jgi:hypothetical protein
VGVFSGAVAPLLESAKEYFPNVEEREEFAKNIMADMANESYHLYSKMYISCGVADVEDLCYWPETRGSYGQHGLVVDGRHDTTELSWGY